MSIYKSSRTIVGVKELHEKKCQEIAARFPSAYISVCTDDSLRLWFKDGFYGRAFEEMLWLSKLLGTTKIDISTENHEHRISEVSVDTWSETTISVSGCKWQSIHEPMIQAIDDWHKDGKKIAWIHSEDRSPINVVCGDWLKIREGFCKITHIESARVGGESLRKIGLVFDRAETSDG